MAYLQISEIAVSAGSGMTSAGAFASVGRWKQNDGEAANDRGLASPEPHPPQISRMRKESIVNHTITQNQEFNGRCQKVLQVAQQLFQGRPDWVTFFRETLGVNGAARSVFPDQDEYVLFEQSPEFADIQTMVANLRNKKVNSGGKNEATRVITVRLPESLHEALKAEAADHKTSMNKLCITKLLQHLAEEEEEQQNQAAAAAANNQAAARGQFSAPGGLPQSAPQTQQPSPAPQFRSTYGE